MQLDLTTIRRIAGLGLLALVAPSMQGCRVPTPSGPIIVHSTPDDIDPYAGTLLSSADLVHAAQFVVEQSDRALGPPTSGSAWRLRLERIDNYTSMSIDPALISAGILARANREAHGRLEFYSPRGELFATQLVAQYAKGERSADSNPARLVTPDYVLFGEIRELAINPSAGLSRFVQISFTVTDLSGRVVWSDVVASKKYEVRHQAYQ